MKVKTVLTIIFDIALIVYLALAFTSFNKPKEKITKCIGVNISIEDETTNGSLAKRKSKAAWRTTTSTLSQNHFAM